MGSERGETSIWASPTGMLWRREENMTWELTRLNYETCSEKKINNGGGGCVKLGAEHYSCPLT